MVVVVVTKAGMAAGFLSCEGGLMRRGNIEKRIEKDGEVHRDGGWK